MRKNSIFLLIVISLLLLPTLVSAKSKTIYLYEDDLAMTDSFEKEFKMFASATARDYLLVQGYSNRDDMDYVMQTIRQGNYSVGDSFRINLDENRICNRNQLPITGYRIEEDNIFSKSVNAMQEENIFNTKIQGMSDAERHMFQEEMEETLCTNVDKYVKQDYNSIIVKIKEGSSPKPNLNINATSIDNILDMNVVSAMILYQLSRSGDIHISLMDHQSEPQTIEEAREIYKNIEFDYKGKSIATFNIYDFKLTIPNNISVNDNISIDADELIEMFIDFNDGSPDAEQEIRRELSFLYDYDFTITLREKEQPKPTPTPTPIVNPKTLANGIAIGLLCLAIMLAFIVPTIKHKKVN